MIFSVREITSAIVGNKEKLLAFINNLGFSCALRFFKRGHLTILNLHRISDERDYFFDPISPQAFDDLLKYVSKHYTVTSFNALDDLGKILSPPLILSFDDGYYDFYQYALPILQKYNLPCNHNIVNECASYNAVVWTQRLNYIFNHCKDHNRDLYFEISGETFKLTDFNHWLTFYIKVFQQLLLVPHEIRTNVISAQEAVLGLKPEYRMMNWREIEDCTRYKVEIGSHTNSHDVISTINNEDQLQREIVQSKLELEAKLNVPINVLSLPNSQGNDAVCELAKKIGIRFLLHSDDKINVLKSFEDQGFNKLSRIGLIRESSPEMILRTEMFHSRLR